jgi:methylenetetrahydrofolate dehydrogenase (NADP+)/methenyltetrahydrofolate cyclohydrolase
MQLSPSGKNDDEGPGTDPGRHDEAGAVVIGIGINVLENGTIAGDPISPLKEGASFLTPVPGGAGPVTIAMLLENTLMSALRCERFKIPLVP